MSDAEGQALPCDGDGVTVGFPAYSGKLVRIAFGDPERWGGVRSISK